MSETDKARWNQRYQDGAYSTRRAPSELVAQWAPRVLAQPTIQASLEPPRALDVACGAGRNALYLSGLGFDVVGVDVSDIALERAAAQEPKPDLVKPRKLTAAKDLSVHWQALDLDAGLPSAPPFDRGFQFIIVVRYADGALVETLTHRLAPGGLLLVEAHLGGPVFSAASEDPEQQPIGGPGGERFRLQPGALAAACVTLETLYVNEGLVTDPDGSLMALSQIVARKNG